MLGRRTYTACFGNVPYGKPFFYKGQQLWRVPKAVDRLGGYNACRADGKRKLFFLHQLVELGDDKEAK